VSTLPDVSRNAESVTLAIFLLNLELLRFPLELGMATPLSDKKQEKGEKQILIGQRVLECGRGKL
jgi:hypothetical protein